MSGKTYEVVKPYVSYKMYWPEIVLLTLSVITPIVSWLVWHDGKILQGSGNVMVFLAAVAEFISLHRLNKKHILNACRVLDNETPWDFSSARQ
jgi:hypothetical protein